MVLNGHHEIPPFGRNDGAFFMIGEEGIGAAKPRQSLPPVTSREYRHFERSEKSHDKPLIAIVVCFIALAKTSTLN
jgi:hypothetical protein